MTSAAWWSVGAVSLGIVLGSGIGLRIGRSSVARLAPVSGAAAVRQAAFVALATFLVVALIEDVSALGGQEKPGFALVKYLFAAGTFFSQWWSLRARVGARPQASNHGRDLD